MSDEVYLIGKTITLSVSFYNKLGVLTNPTTITLKIRLPGGTVTTLTTASLTNVSAGIYTYDYKITQSGLHYYRFDGDGTVDTVEDGMFNVATSIFD